MIITVVASVCHVLAAVPSQPVCHEEIVVQADLPMQACMIGQPAIADWKMHSRFAGDQWRVARVRCIPGDYLPKDAI